MSVFMGGCMILAHLTMYGSMRNWKTLSILFLILFSRMCVGLKKQVFQNGRKEVCDNI